MGGTITTKNTAPATAGLEHKAVSTSPDSGLIGADDATGMVEAIVSVTGIVDDVNDIIQPGAYTKTLTKRRPKGIFVHDWGRWVARTEDIAELMPGDSRLPKQTKDGKPWPAQAGGLYVKAKFNLATREGSDAYHNVKFFSESGECDWSIGYKVPKGAGIRHKDGKRSITEVDLYEYSPVLFGAAGSFSGTLSVKDALSDAEDDEEPGGDVVPDVAADDAQESPQGAAGAVDGDVDWDALDVLADGIAGQAPADDADDEEPSEKGAGGVGHESLDRSPKKNWVEKSGQLPGYIQHIAKDIHEQKGVPLSTAIPTAIAAVKRWAAGGGNVNADTRAKAAQAVAEWEALKAKAHMKSGAQAAASMAGKSLDPADILNSYQPPETKSDEEVGEMSFDGTYEELHDLLIAEATKSLGDEDEDADGAFLIDVIGTWPDRFIATRFPLDGKSAPESFEIPYSADADGVDLGEPVPVDVIVEGAEGDADAEFLLPYGAIIDDVTAGVKVHMLADGDGETKAGKVLSAANTARLKSAVENLVSVLTAAGVPINDGDDDDQNPSVTPATAIAEDSTAPSARSGKLVPEGKVLVDPALQARAYRIMAEVHGGE